MAIERKKFREVFSENLPDEILTTLVPISINGVELPQGYSIPVNAVIGGVKFHSWRYNDVAVENRSGIYFVTGFYRPVSPPSATPQAPAA